jgi:hypothetical protein
MILSKSAQELKPNQFSALAYLASEEAHLFRTFIDQIKNQSVTFVGHEISAGIISFRLFPRAEKL